MPPKKSSKSAAAPKSKSKASKRRKEEEDDDENEGMDEENEEQQDEDQDAGNDEEQQDEDQDAGNDDEQEEEPVAELPAKRARKQTKPMEIASPVPKKTKKVVAAAAAPPPAKSSRKSSGGASSSTPTKEREAPLRIKDMKKFEKLEEARKAFKWWEAAELPPGINWMTLEHAGISFPPPYVRHGVPLLYDEQPTVLPAELEEIATFYAAMPEDGPQLGDAKVRPTFQKNFFKDFSEALGPGHVIQKFSKCDFSRIREHVNLERSLKKAATQHEKEVKKAESERSALKRGYALVDGRLEKMGNFNMEPPGLFRGRGNHPKTGELKKRTFSESVGINLSDDKPVPKTELQGHSWQEVRHDPSVTWLCSWNENVQGMNKYVMLAASSSFKGKSDMQKYGKAIQLKHCIHKVRKDYNEKLVSKDKSERQMGAAMWLIDVLALRVGGEKGEDEADTVGCCSLRVEHLHFDPDPTKLEIELEFLGKDSMLFKQTIDFEKHGEPGRRVFACLKAFVSGKKAESDVFDTLTPQDLNKHLSSIMKGLSAKVFRTFNASVTLEKELPTPEQLDGLSVADKVIRYNAANREVAILCNHQKTVSAAAGAQLETLNTKLEDLVEQKKELEEWRALAKKSKANQIPLDSEDTDERIAERVTKATERLSASGDKSSEERLAAKAELDEAKAEAKKDVLRRFKTKHMYKTVPTVESLDMRIEKWGETIKKLEADIRNRDENKEVALGTSKINYMDPRISVAWCKRCEVPIDKVFAKTLRDKFNWAMAVPPDWKFE